MRRDISRSIVPAMTLKKDILPTNGSATVLYTNSAGSPSVVIGTCLPFSSFSNLRAVGRGKEAAMASSMATMPHRWTAEPQYTGTMVP